MTSVVWYEQDELIQGSKTYTTSIYEQPLEIFQSVKGVLGSNNDFNSTADFNGISDPLKKFDFPSFSVERLSFDTILLSIKYSELINPPKFIALFARTKSDNNSVQQVLVGKIILAEDFNLVAGTVPLVFKLKLPSKVVGITTYYPQFTFLNKKSAEFFGSEMVYVGDHHHAVSDGKDGGRKDIYPQLPMSVYDPFISAKVGEITRNDYSDTKGGSFGELNLEKGSVDLFGGYEVTGVPEDFFSYYDSRINETGNTLEELLLDYLEVYIMAGNKIQILGRAIEQPEAVSNNHNGLTPGGDAYLLYVDKTEPSNNRQLRAIKESNLRKWVVDFKDFSTSDRDYTVKSSVTVLRANNSGSYTFSTDTTTDRRIVIFINNCEFKVTGTGTYMHDVTSNNVTVTNKTASINLTIHPEGVAIFYGFKLSQCKVLDSGSWTWINNIVNGAYAIKKFKVGGTEFGYDKSGLTVTSSPKEGFTVMSKANSSVNVTGNMVEKFTNLSTTTGSYNVDGKVATINGLESVALTSPVINISGKSKFDGAIEGTSSITGSNFIASTTTGTGLEVNDNVNVKLGNRTIKSNVGDIEFDVGSTLKVGKTTSIDNTSIISNTITANTRLNAPNELVIGKSDDKSMKYRSIVISQDVTEDNTPIDRSLKILGDVTATSFIVG